MSDVKLFAYYFPSCFFYINNYLCDFSFFNNWIYCCYICYCCYLIFDPWFSCYNISWQVLVFHSSEKFVHSHPFYNCSTFNCVPISCKSCRYPCIGILYKRTFYLLLESRSRFFVHLVIFHWNIVMNLLNS